MNSASSSQCGRRSLSEAGSLTGYVRDGRGSARPVCLYQPGRVPLSRPVSSMGVIFRAAETCRENRRAGIGGVVFVAVTAACVSPILIPHPAAYRQLIQHAGEQSAVLSAVTGEERNSSLGFVESWVTMMKYGYVYGFLIMGLFLFALLCPFLDSSVTHPAYSRVGILFVSLVLLAIAMPGKYPYLWFQGCWLLIACVALASHVSNFPSWRQRALLVFGACVWLLASTPLFAGRISCGRFHLMNH